MTTPKLLTAEELASILITARDSDGELRVVDVYFSRIDALAGHIDALTACLAEAADLVQLGIESNECCPYCGGLDGHTPDCKAKAWITSWMEP